MNYIYHYETDLGLFSIVENDNAIGQLYLSKKKNNLNYVEEETTIIKRAGQELMEYLNGHRKAFSVDLNPQGTIFQKEVWRALCNIPYGETKSYGDIAKSIGNEKAARAVGNANNKNPILIMIPCHRVIGSDGSLTGFALGVSMKQHLLDIENTHKIID